MNPQSPRQIPSTQLRCETGPLTNRLVLEPGRFGLGQLPRHLQPEGATNLVCGFCSTGCSLRVHIAKGLPLNLSPDPDYPVNAGMACPKGWEALTPLAAPDRALAPRLLDRKTGAFRSLNWPEALQVFCTNLRQVSEKHGRESVAFLSTGQIATEEMAMLGALFKFGMGFLHCDSNTRQCMATSAVAYKESFGFDAPPFTYADFEQSDVLVFVGANPCIAHPIMWQRVLRNPHKPEIIVIDPRRTETAMAATQHHALRPRSDLVLLYGLAHLLIASNSIDRDFIRSHTSGFEAFSEFVSQYTCERTASTTGLPEEDILRLAQTIARGSRVSFWWTMGVNQGYESTRTAQALINLALITGNIGRPGTGANSITGQCNAMGSRLFANVTNLLGGHDFANPAHRSKVATELQIPEDCIPTATGMAYDQILDGIDNGRIKALWVIGTNPVHSWIGHGKLQERLAKLDFLVVQDMYHSTETARVADLLLPAAGWGEKDGTLINSERRIGLIKKVSKAPGHALSDFNIFRLLAHAWGCSDLFQAWSSPEAVFQILKRLSTNQPCDFSAISGYQMLEHAGGIQWPLPAPPVKGFPAERRLFADGRFFHEDGRAKFCFEPPRQDPEPVSAQYPLVLLTGRGSSAQWHTLTRTGKSDALRQLAPLRAYLEIHPDDAKLHGISAGTRVRVASARGEIEVDAFLTPVVQPGQVFLPMHFPEVNRLTLPAFDPYSRQPSYKACAVRVRPGSA